MLKRHRNQHARIVQDGRKFGPVLGTVQERLAGLAIRRVEPDRSREGVVADMQGVGLARATVRETAAVGRGAPSRCPYALVPQLSQPLPPRVLEISPGCLLRFALG